MPVLDLSQDRFDILAHRAMRLLGLEVFQKFLEFFSGVQAKIISRTEESHTHLEWLRFLKQIDRETPKELDLHLIVDNYATHKHPVVQHWLSRHPRFHTHFTPTSSSWLNLVERFFGELTSEVVREGFRS